MSDQRLKHRCRLVVRTRAGERLAHLAPAAALAAAGLAARPHPPASPEGVPPAAAHPRFLPLASLSGSSRSVRSPEIGSPEPTGPGRGSKGPRGAGRRRLDWGRAITPSSLIYLDEWRREAVAALTLSLIEHSLTPVSASLEFGPPRAGAIAPYVVVWADPIEQPLRPSEAARLLHELMPVEWFARFTAEAA